MGVGAGEAVRFERRSVRPVVLGGFPAGVAVFAAFLPGVFAGVVVVVVVAWEERRPGVSRALRALIGAASERDATRLR